ncbi:MAG TPA: histidine kinase [Chitinophagaceae bacterium]|nr:histidine kinase [Chitinophagaceae bacterium]
MLKFSNHKKTGLLFSILIGLFFYLPNILTGINFTGWHEFVLPFLITITYTFTMWMFYPVLKRIKFAKEAYLKFIIFYGAGVLLCFIQYILHKWAVTISPQLDFNTRLPRLFTISYYMSFMQIRYLFINSIILFLLYSQELLNEKRRVEIEKEIIKQEHLSAQYEALKQQLNPHFLFNSLNLLKTLSANNPQKVGDYVIQLSKVYRYLLTHHENKLVKIVDELEFIKSYAYLLEIRFEKAVQIIIKVDASVFNGLIPPLALQLLLENAVKHNIATPTKPLKIEIISKNKNFIEVKNNLQKKEIINSSYSGLINLGQRYKILAKKQIKIQNHKDYFSVMLPII